MDRQPRHALDERGREVRGQRGGFKKHIQKLKETLPVRRAEATRVQKPVEPIVKLGVLQLVLSHQMEDAVERQHAVQTAAVDGRREEVAQGHRRRHVRHHVRVRLDQNLPVNVIWERASEKREPSLLEQLPTLLPVRPLILLLVSLDSARVRLLRGGLNRPFPPLPGETLAVFLFVGRVVNRRAFADGNALAPRAVRVLRVERVGTLSVGIMSIGTRVGTPIPAFHQPQHGLEVLAVAVVVVVCFFGFVLAFLVIDARTGRRSGARVVREVRRASVEDIVQVPRRVLFPLESARVVVVPLALG